MHPACGVLLSQSAELKTCVILFHALVHDLCGAQSLIPLSDMANVSEPLDMFHI